MTDQPWTSGRDFGGHVLQHVVAYLQDHTPEGTIESVFRLAGETRSECEVDQESILYPNPAAHAAGKFFSPPVLVEAGP
jgi:hypothetical protein